MNEHSNCRCSVQSLEALAKANQVRTARAQWKKQVADDRSLIVAAFTDPPEWLLTARVTQLLLAIPKFGPVKVRKIAKAAQLSQSTTVGNLTDRQRLMLIRDLKGRL